MQVIGIRLYRYRNFGAEEVSFSPHTNLFTGDNGQGKTNLLEAVYLLAYGRSFRTPTPADCIQHGMDECSVQGRVRHGAIERTLEVRIARGDKKLLVHDKTAPVDEFVGNLHLLAFTSDFLKIIRGAPGERRAFLDRGMVTLYPGHLRRLAAYQRALKQRNRILALARDSGSEADEGHLRTWDQTLVGEGAPIVRDRRRYAAELKQSLPGGLFGPERIRLHYVSSVPGEETGTEEIREAFRARLIEVRDSDARRGFTTVGPHRDDLRIYADGKSLADFGSAGQQRSSLLSLYFAQMEIHRHQHGFHPVFLMDDAEAELDERRLKIFMDYIGRRTQLFLTSAKPGLLADLQGDVRRVEIRAGTAVAAPGQAPL